MQRYSFTIKLKDGRKDEVWYTFKAVFQGMNLMINQDNQSNKFRKFDRQ